MLVSDDPRASRRAIAGWLLFDWAAQPFFTLVTTFVFAPYFAARVAPDPAAGQAAWAFAVSLSGLAIAFLSPVLGAVADAGGRRKPWIAGFSVLLVLGSAALWWAEPSGGRIVPLWPALLAFAVATVGAEFTTVFTNAMMPSLVPPQRLGRLSGSGWALGYAGGLLSLGFVLALMAGSPETGLTLAGIEPVLGLDPAFGEGARATGPLTAIWYAVFVLPLFLFTPDVVPGFHARSNAIRTGLADLARTLKDVRAHRNVLTFLVARMLYADGLAALFAFGGIYAASTFGWGTQEIGLFGILIIVSATLGAWIGGRVDDAIGPKRTILLALLGLVTASVGLLSITRTSVLFGMPAMPPELGAAPFASLPERAYIGFGLLLGAVSGPAQSASRTLLARLAPPEKMTQFFGLYALSGRVTSFAAPALIGMVTLWSGSQRLGIATIVLFFLAGMAMLTRVSAVSGAGALRPRGRAAGRASGRARR